MKGDTRSLDHSSYREHRVNGKENGNYYNGIIWGLYCRGYIGIMEKKMETTSLDHPLYNSSFHFIFHFLFHLIMLRARSSCVQFKFPFDSPLLRGILGV